MSPATPPQSPSPSKSRVSPNKGRDLPTKGRDSPTKFNLEVGQNGFHFQCQISESKIVPKKVDQGASTPTSRTPSPIKMGSARAAAASRGTSPVKGTPSTRTSPAKQTANPTFESPVQVAKKETPRKPVLKDFAAVKSSATRNGLPRKSAPALSHSPRNKATTPIPEKHIGSARTSPSKITKMATKFAEGSTTPCESPKHDAEVVKEETTTSVQVIPDTPASTSSPRPLLNATGKPPTRAKRGPRFDIGDMMAGLKDLASKPRAEVVERVGETNISQPPTPLRKAAEKLQPIISIKDLGFKPNISTKDTAIDMAPTLLAQPAMTTLSSSQFRIKERALPYQPLLIPPPEPCPSPEPGKTSPLEKHVKFEDGDDNKVSKYSRPAFPKVVQRNGTDPDVMLAMQREMDSLQMSLSSSLGVNFRTYKGKENTFELPNMANSVQKLDSGLRASARPKRTSLHTISDMSNASSSTTASSLRASMLMYPRVPPTKLPAPSSRARKWPYAGKTPAQARRERFVVAAKEEEDEEQCQTLGDHPKPLLKTLPLKTASILRVDKLTNKANTPRTKGSGFVTPAHCRASPMPVKLHSTPRSSGLTTATLARARGTPRSTIARADTMTTPAKSKFIGGGIPQSPRRSVFESPASNRRAATPTAGSKVAVPASARKTPAPALRHDGTPILKFASAKVIADRVAVWNGEDRKMAELGTPRKGDPNDSTPNKSRKQESTTPEGSPGKDDKQESHTPKGSPTKLPSRAPAKPSCLVPPKLKGKAMTPKRAAPKAPTTPRVQNKAVARLRGQNTRTPISCALDPNAYRTPSKEIESSLDRAIDRKIDEDAKAGKEFTPSGNRIKDLLEARRWK
jgi:hypothetical protein